ncbi:SAM-dependent methyltransferase [Actinoplanes sp. LDG1-06]|uniref:SAM-dependent methyltransferase n=1 Tax=Paractinoplanes ovalisporus TaxID=2810368 RepID=A0ABS2AGZ0_9ACTN|nr:SAM-dependent methyltransferase [Actinoplanes ovalisporus]MBM2619090.1 SAM-dependent methyltransferase [Actinoplanes ovalisporus]
MPQPLAEALAEVRELLLGPGLVRAVGAGRRRGFTPSVTRAEVRPVTLKGGARLQIVTNDGVRPYTRNVASGGEASAAVDELLAEPFANWHVETGAVTLQLRVTKKGDAQVHRAAAAPAVVPSAAPSSSPVGASSSSSAGRASSGGASSSAVGASPSAFAASSPSLDPSLPALGHDRQKQWLLDPGDPLFRVIGGNAAKRRQIDAFLRALAATLPKTLPPTLRVVDLGCGNAYLTFAAYRYLAGRGASVRVVGVDVREDQRVRNTAVATELGCAEEVTFVAGTIEDAELPFAPDLVLALHACDTATDQALARAVEWKAEWVLAAPCCHHDIAAQLKGRPAPAPFGELTRHAIMRERFADVLTDSLRAALLRLNGYKVEVVEFIDSAHTPRNLLLRSRRTATPPTEAQRADYEALTSEWGVTPALEKMLT